MRAFAELISLCKLTHSGSSLFFYQGNYVMSVKEILEVEKRDKDNLYDIHLYLEGMFWKACEWSAYLCNNFPSNLSNQERLKPIIKTNKHVGNIVQVGLPLTSFKKYFPCVMDNDSIIEKCEKHIIIHCKDFFKSYDFIDYDNILKKWKDDILNNDKKQVISPKSDIDCLLDEIISYQIESKTLIENLGFLSHIKEVAMKIKEKSKKML